ncbi:MAG: leucine-rich repeat domain-containing protein [Bacillota bacterium]
MIKNAKLVSIALILLILLNMSIVAFAQANTVTFEDENLEAAVRSAINKYQGDILVSEVQDVLSLDGTAMNIQSLEGIQYMTGLEYLYLAGNNISDITPLKDLTSLKSLMLCENNITDISSISNLINLQSLSLRINNITDISPLENTVMLTLLKLEGNSISDYSPVESYYNNLNYRDFILSADGSVYFTSEYPHIKNLRPDILMNAGAVSNYTHASIAGNYSENNIVWIMSIVNELHRLQLYNISSPFAYYYLDKETDSKNNTIYDFDHPSSDYMARFNINNDYWVTVIHDSDHNPVCAFYEEYVDYDTAWKAYEAIIDGNLENLPYRLAWVYIVGSDMKVIENSVLRSIVANAEVTDEELADITAPILDSLDSDELLSYRAVFSVAYTREDGIYKGIMLQAYEDGLTASNQAVLKTSGGLGYEKVYYFMEKEAAAPELIRIELQIDNKYMRVNGVEQEIDPGKDTAPVLVNSKTMLPIRAVIEALGGYSRLGC